MVELVDYKPASGGHWYDKDGNPCHWQIKKDGGKRPTHIGDARRLGLVPSVTTVLNVISKPAIANWKVKHALTAMRDANGDEKLARQLMDERMSEAPNTGTAYHKDLEELFGGVKDTPEYMPMETWLATQAAVHSICGGVGKLVLEGRFANPEFAGCVDLEWISDDPIIVDFKTKGKGGKDLKAWPDNLWQIAGYRMARSPKARAINLFISTVNPGEVVVHEWTPEELMKGQHVFQNALSLWQAMNEWEVV